MAHLVLGHVLSQVGRHAEAAKLVERARELDPLSAMVHAISSQVAFQAREYPAALAHARRAIALEPGFWIGYMMRGQAQEQLGEIDEALEALAVAGRLSGQNSKPLSLRAYILATTGRRDDARELLSTLEVASQSRYVPPYAVALVHLGLQEHDQALDLLERAYAERDAHLLFLTMDPK